MTTDTKKLIAVFEAEFQATRSLEQAVSAVATAVKTQLELPGVTLKVTVVHQFTRPSAHTDAMAAYVVELAATALGIEPRHLSERWTLKSGPHIEARWVIAASMRAMGRSLPVCGRAACYRDHTPVIYALKQVEARPDLKAVVARIVREVRCLAVVTAEGAAAGAPEAEVA